MKKTKKNIIAIESWDDEFKTKQKTIMKYILDFLEITTGVSHSYHYIYTSGELSYVLKNIPTGKYSILYLAMHGKPGEVATGAYSEFSITLSELAEFMGKRFQGYGVHFASCATLNGWKDQLLEFKEKTGVSFISGFSKYIGFNSSAIVDLSLLTEWADSRSYKRMFERLAYKNKRLFDENGFEWMI